MHATTALALAAVLTAGCASPRLAETLPPVARDSVAIELLAPVTDLSGAWATGTTNEPPPGPVNDHPSCAHNPAVWIIEQKGNALRTWAFPESFNQGIARRDPVQRMHAIPGTISGAAVAIRSDDVRMALQYDSASGHLRGTRNGNPFWAARQIIVREPCPGIP